MSGGVWRGFRAPRSCNWGCLGQTFVRPLWQSQAVRPGKGEATRVKDRRREITRKKSDPSPLGRKLCPRSPQQSGQDTQHQRSAFGWGRDPGGSHPKVLATVAMRASMGTKPLPQRTRSAQSSAAPSSFMDRGRLRRPHRKCSPPFRGGLRPPHSEKKEGKKHIRPLPGPPTPRERDFIFYHSS